MNRRLDFKRGLNACGAVPLPKTGKLILQPAQDEIDPDRRDDQGHDPRDDIDAGGAENTSERFINGYRADRVDQPVKQESFTHKLMPTHTFTRNRTIVTICFFLNNSGHSQRVLQISQP